jgi:hypothetical protein
MTSALFLGACSHLPVTENSCKPAHGEISFADADGDTELFANLKFSVRRASDGTIVYQGTTDGKARATWQGGCAGDDFIIRQDGFLDAE